LGARSVSWRSGRVRRLVCCGGRRGERQRASAALGLDPNNNNNVTSAAYDPLGRRVKVWEPNHPLAANAKSPSISFAYTVSQTAATAVATTTLMADGATQTGYTLYDGLLRARQTQAPSEGGGSLGARQ
jgi:hypothetical protein